MSMMYMPEFGQPLEHIPLPNRHPFYHHWTEQPQRRLDSHLDLILFQIHIVHHEQLTWQPFDMILSRHNRLGSQSMILIHHNLHRLDHFDVPIII